MLEIGCSYGAILARFSLAGWEVEGVEIDARAASYAREQFGLRVHTGSLEGVRRSLAGSYDVVAAYHVVEHIQDLDGILSLVAKLLAPGGRLIMKTPNVGSLAARIGQGWWEWACAPEHVHLFTVASLRRCLARAGLVLERWTTRRGDARSTPVESARAVVSRVLSRERVPERYCEWRVAAQAIATRGRVREVVQRALEACSAPFEWYLSRRWVHGSEGGPELLAVAQYRGMALVPESREGQREDLRQYSR
jgi:SAM-dependent methyltransferase